MKCPKTAMVLAAGLGTRMRPLTDAVPKPLVRLKGIALIDRVLDRLADAGVETAVVNVHYMADAVERHLASRTRPHIEISDERGVLLETGGGVVRALARLGAEPFYIHNSDSVWIEQGSASLARMSAAFDPELMDSLMLLAHRETSIGYDGPGDFHMADDGRLRRRKEGEATPFVFTGVSIAHPRLFYGAREERFSLNRLWDRSIARNRVFGILLDGLWMHVGTPEALIDAERAIDRAEA